MSSTSFYSGTGSDSNDESSNSLTSFYTGSGIDSNNVSSLESILSAVQLLAADATFALDSFTDTYLGAKFSDPLTDNDGDELKIGALYWNTPSQTLKAYSGSNWTAVGEKNTVTLANNTGGHKAVTHDGNLVQTDTLDRYAGVTVTAGDAGKDVVIQRLGIMEDPSFSFTPNQPIFIGADGALTQTATFPMLRIGLALTTTKIELNPQPFIGV